MFGALLLVIRAFLVGVGGVLVAPRSGAQTRRLLAASVALLTESIADVPGIRAEPALLPERFGREPSERAARV